MPPKRKSSNAGSRRKKKVKKSKSKKKGGTDWYTDGNDGDQDGTDLFSDDDEVNNDTKTETEVDGATDDDNNGEDAEMVDEIEEEEEDDQNTSNATKRYDSLLSSLLSTPSESLAEADRRQLERVRLERQGIELAMSDEEEEDDENESSDESDDDAKVEAIDEQNEEEEEEEEIEEADTSVTKLDEDSAVSVYDSVYESHFGNEGLTKQQIKLAANPSKWEYQHNSVKLPARGTNGSLALPAMRYSIKLATLVPELSKVVDDALVEADNKKNKRSKKALGSQVTSAVMPYDYGMRPRLAKRWGTINKGVQNSISQVDDPKDRSSLGLTGLQEQLLPHVLSYRDVVFTDRNIFNAVELREMYALHIMNHIFRSRDTVLRNTQKLKRHSMQVRADKTAAKAAKEMGVDAPKPLAEEAPDTDLMRDQGFTRARVLVVLPMRNAAARLMKLLIDLMPQGSQIQNRSRFFAEFGDEDVASETAKENAADFNEDEILKGRRGLGEEAVAEAAAQLKGKNKPRLLDRTPDWRATFEGNTDDCFRVGVAFPNRKSMRIFSDFYQSDLIIASPLGLRLATKQDVGASTGADSGSDEGADDQVSEAEKEEDDEDDEKENDDGAEPWEQVCQRGDVDFLSSIEVLVVDQADVFHMQNWQHLVDVTSSALNLQPKEVRPDTDFARVRPLFLEKTAALFRQTLVFSGHVDPYLNALTVGKLGLCRNAFGVVQVKRAKRPGAIMDVLSSFPQRFMRIDASEARLAKRGALQAFADARFTFFRDTVMPSLTGPAAAGTLVFVPSYFDFVRVRNLFAAAEKEGKTRGMLDALPARHGGDGPGGRNGAAKGKGKGKKKVVVAEEEATLFTTCSEYTEAADVTRARGDFFHGRARVMLTTERFHFFFRYKLRGIRRVVFYSPPTYGHFYSEMLNLVEDSDSSNNKKEASKSSSLCLYTGGDALALESVVGSAHAAGMLAAEDPSQVFSYA